MEQWVGRDSNPEPTPKAFGAALIEPFSLSNSVLKIASCGFFLRLS